MCEHDPKWYGIFLRCSVCSKVFQSLAGAQYGGNMRYAHT